MAWCVNLANTGDNHGTPQAVVSAMLDEMTRRRLGSSDDRLKPYSPRFMINDPQTAIVEVYAYLPPGGRSGQRLDVFVQAARNSQTNPSPAAIFIKQSLSSAASIPSIPSPSPM